MGLTVICSHTIAASCSPRRLVKWRCKFLQCPTSSHLFSLPSFHYFILLQTFHLLFFDYFIPFFFPLLILFFSLCYLAFSFIISYPPFIAFFLPFHMSFPPIWLTASASLFHFVHPFLVPFVFSFFLSSFPFKCYYLKIDLMNLYWPPVTNFIKLSKWMSWSKMCKCLKPPIPHSFCFFCSRILGEWL